MGGYALSGGQREEDSVAATGVDLVVSLCRPLEGRAADRDQEGAGGSGGGKVGRFACCSAGGEVVPATGRSLSDFYADVFEIDGDRIVSERLYYDHVELLMHSSG